MFDQMDIACGGPKAPCGKVCPKRTAECHATCPEWLIYEKKREAFRQERYLSRLGRVNSLTLKSHMDEEAIRKNR